jgi:hypothetical protein
MSSFDADLERALQGISSLAPTAQQLAMSNPKLYNFLDEKWTAAQATGTNRWDFIADTTDLLRSSIRNGNSHFSYDLIAERRRIERDIAIWQRGQAAGSCSAYLSGNSPNNIPIDLKERDKRWQVKALNEIDANDKPRTAVTFRIPASVYTRMKSLSGLSETQLEATLHNTGSDAQRCASWIALVNAALEAPPSVGLPVLREM